MSSLPTQAAPCEKAATNRINQHHMNNITMNSKTNITVTLTRKEAECLQWTADYAVNDEIGDFIDWSEGEKETFKYANQALGKISAALRHELI